MIATYEKHYNKNNNNDCIDDDSHNTEKVIYFLLLDRKRRKPSYEDETECIIRNRSESGKFLIKFC